MSSFNALPSAPQYGETEPIYPTLLNEFKPPKHLNCKIFLSKILENLFEIENTIPAKKLNPNDQMIWDSFLREISRSSRYISSNALMYSGHVLLCLFSENKGKNPFHLKAIEKKFLMA